MHNLKRVSFVTLAVLLTGLTFWGYFAGHRKNIVLHKQHHVNEVKPFIHLEENGDSIKIGGTDGINIQSNHGHGGSVRIGKDGIIINDGKGDNSTSVNILNFIKINSGDVDIDFEDDFDDIHNDIE